MTESSAREDLPEEAAVARYLESHPDFFNRQPELLAGLEIPHATGQAVSLWERQIAALRSDNQRLSARFEQFLAQAKRNEALIGRIHALSLSLMQAAGPQAVFGLLETRFCAEFDADRVTVRVYGAPAFVDSEDTPQFVGPEAAGRAELAHLLATPAARCGPLTEAEARALFGGEAKQLGTGSHALLPLAGRGWDGLLVVSSRDARRFEPHMGTEFLAYLRDVLVLVLDPWVAKPRRSRRE